MKVAFIHPLKHHIFHSMAGAIKSNAEVVGFFAYYDRNDFIDRIVKKTKWKNQIKGYNYEKINGYVRTNYIVKILFLMNKVNPVVFGKLFDIVYSQWCICNIKDVDCIHVLQDYENGVIRYARKHNIKIVYEQILAYDIDKYIGRETKNQKKLNRQKENLLISDYILMASKFVKKSIIDRISVDELNKKCHVIPYGADIEKFVYCKKEYNNGETLNLLCVASISERKGIKYLISAMEQLNEKPVVLTMIGVPVDNEQDLFTLMKSCKNIKYVGRVPHSEIPKYYEKSHVFILPSLAEGSSLSVYEALASGLPCIVTENTGSVIENGKDGYIIRTEDVSSIVEAITHFLNYPNTVKKMSENTVQTMAHYTWDNFESKICDLYNSIVIENSL